VRPRQCHLLHLRRPIPTPSGSRRRAPPIQVWGLAGAKLSHGCSWCPGHFPGPAAAHRANRRRWRRRVGAPAHQALVSRAFIFLFLFSVLYVICFQLNKKMCSPARRSADANGQRGGQRPFVSVAQCKRTKSDAIWARNASGYWRCPYSKKAIYKSQIWAAQGYGCMSSTCSARMYKDAFSHLSSFPFESLWSTLFLVKVRNGLLGAHAWGPKGKQDLDCNRKGAAWNSGKWKRSRDSSCWHVLMSSELVILCAAFQMNCGLWNTK
jgi:hypothetical protein